MNLIYIDMNKIFNIDSSFILISFQNSENFLEDKNIYEKTISILYSKDYFIVPLSKFENNKLNNSLLAMNDTITNDELRADSIYLIDYFDRDSLILKYKKEDNAVRLNKNGSETLLSFVDGNLSDTTENFFILEGKSFSFQEMKRYNYPKRKEDLKNGMMVEFLNNEKWVRKPIKDIDVEFEKMYKLLIKYNKLRVEVNQI